jgi:benzoyl-CoA 2,3-dioxygenase component B
MRVVDGQLVTEEVPALRSINSRLLDDYIADCQGGIDRWNKVIEKAGINFRFTQPHKAFNRKIGEFARVRVNPAGEILSEEAWQAGQGDWLCNDDDYDHINSLMKPCFEAGQYASWIAPPRVGINNQPQDFEYVRIEHS